MPERLRFLILSGPTREYLDPVRYISNASSGKQGMALAEEAMRRGHAVELVLGPVAERPPPGAQIHAVETAGEMLEAARARHPFCDVLIGAAAVSDFRLAKPNAAKRKRDQGRWVVELEPTADILATLGSQKGMRVHAGFALETECALANGMRKLFSKRLDWIVVNGPGAIGVGDGEYHILGADSSHQFLGRVSKAELARRLLAAVEQTAAGRCFLR